MVFLSVVFWYGSLLLRPLHILQLPRFPQVLSSKGKTTTPGAREFEGNSWRKATGIENTRLIVSKTIAVKEKTSEPTGKDQDRGTNVSGSKVVRETTAYNKPTDVGVITRVPGGVPTTIYNPGFSQPPSKNAPQNGGLAFVGCPVGYIDQSTPNEQICYFPPKEINVPIETPVSIPGGDFVYLPVIIVDRVDIGKVPISTLIVGDPVAGSGRKDLK